MTRALSLGHWEDKGSAPKRHREFCPTQVQGLCVVFISLTPKINIYK